MFNVFPSILSPWWLMTTARSPKFLSVYVSQFIPQHTLSISSDRPTVVGFLGGVDDRLKLTIVYRGSVRVLW